MSLHRALCNITSKQMKVKSKTLYSNLSFALLLATSAYFLLRNITTISHHTHQWHTYVVFNFTSVSQFEEKKMAKHVHGLSHKSQPPFRIISQVLHCTAAVNAQECWLVVAVRKVLKLYFEIAKNFAVILTELGGRKEMPKSSHTAENSGRFCELWPFQQFCQQNTS